MPTHRTYKSAFSLIELMIVVVILGMLAIIIIPMFGYSENNAKEDAVIAEMAAIRRAWNDFHTDNFPANTERAELARYGLYPLCHTNEPTGYTGEWEKAVRGEYDPYNKLGWNGPYLMHEGTTNINTAVAGQDETGGFQIPIVRDPYGGFYRVMASVSNKLSLVCTGRDQELDTSDDTALPLMPF